MLTESASYSAALMAFEIRNPLSSIKGIASYFKNKFDEDSDDKEMAGVMIHEVDRLNHHAVINRKRTVHTLSIVSGREESD